MYIAIRTPQTRANARVVSAETVMGQNDVQSVRQARENEIEQLADIWYQGWEDGHAAILPAELVRLRTWESFKERLRAALHTVRVVGPVRAGKGGAAIQPMFDRRERCVENMFCPFPSNSSWSGLQLRLRGDALGTNPSSVWRNSLSRSRS